jgi:hypothetical protein
MGWTWIKTIYFWVHYQAFDPYRTYGFGANFLTEEVDKFVGDGRLWIIQDFHLGGPQIRHALWMMHPPAEDETPHVHLYCINKQKACSCQLLPSGKLT